MSFGSVFWSMAWRNLRLHYRRSLITGLAIAFGFCGVVLLGGYMMRMENYLKTQGIYLSHSGHISIYKKEGLQKHLTDPEVYSLSLDDQNNIVEAAQSLKSKPVFVARYLHGQGLITNGCRSFPFFMTASEPESETWVRTHPLTRFWTPELLTLKKGKGFWEMSGDASNDSIVVAYRLARLLQKPLVAGDPTENVSAADQVLENCENNETAWSTIRSHAGIQLIGSNFGGGLAAADAKISGHYTTGLAMSDAGSILVPLKFAQSFYGTDQVTWMSLFLGEGDVTKLVAKKLKTIFSERKLDYDVYDYRDERVNQYYVGAMNFVYVMMVFFLFLVCGVVALSILNSLQISLLERKVELGTLRSIGFKQKEVSALFVKEVFLLSTISIVTGGVIAFVIANLINAMDLRFPLVGTADEIQFMLRPELWLSVITGFIFIAVACLTCYFESNRRLRAPITSLLEYGA
jgi:putative ABC transport system permease protein